MTDQSELSATQVEEAVERLAQSIADRHAQTKGLLLVGIADGGVGLAARLSAKLAALLEREISVGVVDVSFHRDDIGSNPIPKAGSPTDLPPTVEGTACVLVDDVLFSGRTIRAALNELFDQGRPESVELAVLVDRGGRKLPIAPDYVGLALLASAEQNVEASVAAAPSSSDHVSVTSP